jgi:hypothetical protein
MNILFFRLDCASPLDPVGIPEEKEDVNTTLL